MNQPIFYFERLKGFDKWTIGLYVILTLILFYYFQKTQDTDIRNSIILGYGLLTQFGLYVFCYKSLRNLTAFFIWLCIGLFHLYLYLLLKDDQTLRMYRGHATTPLRNTVWLLVLFQLFRFLSAKIQGQELVAPSHGGTTDLFDERRVSWLDYVFFFLYMSCVIVFDF